MGSWSHMVKWGKKTSVNMHEMLVFGVEINTCVVGVCLHMCVCIYLHMLVICPLSCSQSVSEKRHSSLATFVASWKRVGMTFHHLPFVLWNFVPCTCIIYSKINSF